MHSQVLFSQVLMLNILANKFWLVTMRIHVLEALLDIGLYLNSHYPRQGNIIHSIVLHYLAFY
jgi:hypothetical protein